MAIAFDAVTTGTATSSGTFQWNHTCTGSDLILWVGVWMGTADDVAVTYNGVSMTVAVKVQAPGDNLWHYLFYLVSPATGSNQVSCTGTNSYGTCRGVAASYTGVNTGTPDLITDSTTNASATTIDCNVTTTQDNCWGVGWCRASAAGADVVFSVSATNRQVANGGGADDDSVFADSNGSLGAAAAETFTMTTGVSGAMAGLMATFAPTGGGGSPVGPLAGGKLVGGGILSGRLVA